MVLRAIWLQPQNLKYEKYSEKNGKKQNKLLKIMSIFIGFWLINKPQTGRKTIRGEKTEESVT